ncbi:MAG: LamG-like jellyroll fold domain-containing protein [Rhodospirillales bacterium]
MPRILPFLLLSLSLQAWSATPAQPASWTPAALGAAASWYDESGFSVLGGRVYRWADRSSNFRDLLQTDPNRQPAYDANGPTGYNGLPSVIFDGASSYLHANGFNLGGTAVSVFAATKQATDVAASARLVSFAASGDADDASAGTSAAFLFVGGAGRGSMRSYRNGASYTDPYSNADGTENYIDHPTRTGIIYDGTYATLYRDGAAEGVFASSGGFGPSGELVVGARAPSALGTDFWKGPIAKLVVVNRALTSDEIAALDQWLRLPVNPATIMLTADGDSLSYTGPTFGGYTYAAMSGLNHPYFLNNMAIGGSRLVNEVARAVTWIDPLIPTDKRGAQYLYSNWIGHNDIDDYLGITDVSVAAATYAATLAAEVAARKAAGYDKAVVFTVLSRSDSAYPLHNQYRNAFNAYIRAAGWAAANGIDAICDVAADPNIGPDGASDSLTYYQADHVHLNPAGHAIVKSIWQATLNGLNP